MKLIILTTIAIIAILTLIGYGFILMGRNMWGGFDDEDNIIG